MSILIYSNNRIRIFLFIFFFLSNKYQSINLSEKKFVLNIKGNSDKLNYYYTTLFIGKEKQKQSFILDTTSSVTTSPCTLCKVCGDHINDYYIINKDNSLIGMNSKECNYLPNIFKDTSQLDQKNNIEGNNCKFLFELEKEKIYGIYSNNLISFETVSSNSNDNNSYISKENEFFLPLGCSLEETGFLQSSLADGIFGLNNDDKSFISMLYRKELIKKNIFSICLEQEGGYLSLGDIDTQYHICSDIKYIDYNPNEKLYEITTEKITINNFEIPSKYISSINSASTISYFPNDIFLNITSAFFAICSEYEEEQCGQLKRINGYGLCSDFKISSNYTNALRYIFPTIKIKFNNYEFNWEPKNYALNFGFKNKKRLCFGIDTEKNLDKIILGTNFMHGYDIIFDRANFKIGFCEASCARNMTQKEESLLNKELMKKQKEQFENNIKKEIKRENINEEEDKEFDINILNISDNTKKEIINNKENNYEINFKYLIIGFIIAFILFFGIILIKNLYNDDIIMDKNLSLVKMEKISFEQYEKKDINEKSSVGQKIEMVGTGDNNSYIILFSFLFKHVINYIKKIKF